MVVAYQLVEQEKSGLQIIYQKHKRYIMEKGLSHSPRDLFQRDLLRALSEWRKQGDCIALFIDMNEHALTGTLAAKLRGMGLVEATHWYWGDSKPNTFINSSQPIDAVYHTHDLEIVAVAKLSFHEGVGDRRIVVVDISTRSMIGQQEYKVVRPTARRFVTRKQNMYTQVPGGCNQAILDPLACGATADDCYNPWQQWNHTGSGLGNGTDWRPENRNSAGCRETLPYVQDGPPAFQSSCSLPTQTKGSFLQFEGLARKVNDKQPHYLQHTQGGDPSEAATHNWRLHGWYCGL
jgi:hypothetical protein